MKTTVKIGDAQYIANLKMPIDISIPLVNGPSQVNCFYAPFYESVAVKEGSFIGDTRQGGPVNFKNIRINPHGNGTHTECVGHISTGGESIYDTLKQFHFTAQLVSVFPEKIDGDRVVTMESLRGISLSEVDALILRTLPNDEEKKVRAYSGTNPPYVDPKVILYLNDKAIMHFLLDLPSVDREQDEGRLSAHKAFWNYPENPDKVKTITELIFVDNEVSDGLYLLNIQTISLDIDASPSKPVIYRLTKDES